ncbi:MULTISPECIES: rod shape-determining protein MreC [unclassified Sphingomonas]|uniref:rod shape-determining protein MreC n=1 Tax=unclassified Sphingomonas TaxID=196159 RepID=UPI000BC43173|nr:MAG: rod shape-determining protein MreC [Sphingomonas sp. 32-62-10]
MASPRNRRPGFSRRAQYGFFLGYVFAVAGSLVAAALLALSTFDPSTFAALRLALAEVTTPISTGVGVIGRGFISIPGAIGDHFALQQRNAALRKQIEDSNALLMRARALSYDNRRLRKLLELRDRTSDPVTTARLVSSTASSTRRFAVLNAGFRQGVATGQPVRGPEGLVGRILEAGPNTARVLLLSDPESIVPVRRTRDGLPAIAMGRGDGWIEVRSVALLNATFLPGDVLITSGTGGIYPPNIPVARIIRRSTDTALARSFAQPDTLDFALVQRAFMPMPRTEGMAPEASAPQPTITPPAKVQEKRP